MIAEPLLGPPACLRADPVEEALARVEEAIRRLPFGEVRILVHRGQVTQIDVTDRWKPDR